MRIVVQRVKEASVTVDGRVVSSIGSGLCVLVGIAAGDTREDVIAAVDKISALRVFPDTDGKLNLSIGRVGGEILVVSQFTLLGDARRGNRPSFSSAARPEVAAPLVTSLAEGFAALGIVTKTGVFGAAMELGMINDGPVTLVLELTDGRVI